MKIRRKVIETVAAGALGCAVWLSPGWVQAWSCVTNWIQVPEDGASNVPVDTLLWSYGQSGTSARTRLLGPAGEVAVEQRWLPIAYAPGAGTVLPVLVPIAALEPDTRYTLETRHEQSVGGEEVIEYVRFTTGPGSADAPPPLPEVMAITQQGRLGFTGLNRGLKLDVPHEGILIGASGGALGAADSIDDLLLSEVSSFPFELDASSSIARWLTTRDVLSVGVGDCLVWPEDGADRHDVRLGVLDFAGNFSGWSETVLTLPSVAEAQPLADAWQANEDAQHQERLARATAEPRRGAFANHEMGCTLARPRASWHMTSAALVLGAALVARQRRRCSARS